MPKMKTKKAAAKRFSVTGTGKVKLKQANMRHIMSHKSANYRRKKIKGAIASECNMASLRGMLPYAF